ncbi:MAG TPA: hypothetical protein VEA78_06010, partial [Acidimicrobiales bacterium]|nr:hypothetical protein [Acidimicrobiales bacterium]
MLGGGGEGAAAALPAEVTCAITACRLRIGAFASTDGPAVARPGYQPWSALGGGGGEGCRGWNTAGPAPGAACVSTACSR